jgi:DNA polymerase-3 subunit epsilon
MNLQLKRPIIFFDLETTGVDTATDRIVEISLVKIDVDGTKSVKTRRINPEMPIPAISTAVHGITDADVAACPTFKEVAKTIAADFKGCDLAGYNSSRFDVPLLVEEMLRAGVDFDISRRKQIDVQTIFHKMEQRTLSAAYRFYCEKELDNAHSAEADTRATYEVLKSQLDRYSNLPNDMGALAEFTTYNNNIDLAGRIIKDEQGRAVFNFGKHKGKLVFDVFATDFGFYDWMQKGEFTLNTKKVLTELYMEYQRKKMGL